MQRILVLVALVGCGSSKATSGTEPPTPVVIPDAGAAPDSAPSPGPGQCGTDDDCTLTMIPAQPKCCEGLCTPRAIRKVELRILEADVAGLDCRAVRCRPQACAPPQKVKAVCRSGACETAPR